MSGPLAVIPARGGSQRIPHKNIKPFVGRPIIEYSIEAALLSGVFGKVIVSTDDEQIAKLAVAAGAQVPFVRPAELSDGHTGTNAVVAHAVATMRGQGFPANAVCCIYATAPFVRAKDIRKSFEAFNRSDAPFLFSVARFHFPVQRALRLDAQNLVSPFQPEHILKRSQDLEPGWHDAGQFYWGRPEAFEQGHSLYEGHSVGWPLDPDRVQDIDTLDDWARAEFLYAYLDSQNRRL